MNLEFTLKGFLQADEEKGVVSRLLDTGFTLLGVPFTFEVESACEHFNNNYYVYICVPQVLLARGSSIDVHLDYPDSENTVMIDSSYYPDWELKRTKRVCLRHAHRRKCLIVHFPSAFEFILKITFSDVYPWRHIFVNEEAATTKCFDFRIIVEGEEETPLFVNKAIVSLDSAYFQALFSGNNYKECIDGVLTLSGTTVDEILEYLYCIYPPCRPIAFERFEVIWKLADRFQNHRLMRTVESFLFSNLKSIDVEKNGLKKILCWAKENQQMEVLQAALENYDGDSVLLPKLRKNLLSDNETETLLTLYAEMLTRE